MLHVACVTYGATVGEYYNSKGLRELRLALGLTQWELAMLLGVNRVTVARWEGGGALAATAGAWLSALETAWRAVSLHAEKAPGRFAFLDDLTTAGVPRAWAHVLALAFPDVHGKAAEMRTDMQQVSEDG
jgi:DNA-binding XRE family transcriptional regulator